MFAVKSKYCADECMCESSFLIWICSVIGLKNRMSPSLSCRWDRAAANSFNLRGSSQGILLHMQKILSLIDGSHK